MAQLHCSVHVKGVICMRHGDQARLVSPDTVWSVAGEGEVIHQSLQQRKTHKLQAVNYRLELRVLNSKLKCHTSVWYN